MGEFHLILPLTFVGIYISILVITKTKTAFMINPQKLTRIFRALSVEARVRIVQLLKDHTLCVGALSSRLDITQGAVSQHLRVLRDADLLVSEKRGYYVHYRLNEKTLLTWKKTVDAFLAKATETEAFEGLRNPQQKGAKRCVRERRGVRSRRS